MWPDARVSGEGRWAVVTKCSVCTVELFRHHTEAYWEKRAADKYGCCSVCTKDHEVVNLKKVEVPV